MRVNVAPPLRQLDPTAAPRSAHGRAVDPYIQPAYRCLVPEPGDVSGDDRAARPFKLSLPCPLDPLVQDRRVIGDLRTTPNVSKINVRVGQKVILNVTSDTDNEINAYRRQLLSQPDTSPSGPDSSFITC
jgi:hypothetical protein